MINDVILVKNEQLLKTKKLVLLLTGFNAAVFGVLAAIAAINGEYALFVATFVLCLTNAVFLMYGYNKYEGEKIW